MWSEQFELLSAQEQDRFRKITNYLLNKSFMVSEIYEPRDRVGKINGDYRFLERNFDLFSEYLSYAGYTLTKDDARGVVSVNNIYGYNNVKLDKLTTLFLVALRNIYDEEMEKNSARNVVFLKVSDVILRMLEDNLIVKKPTVKDLVDTLRLLTRYNIISRLEGALEDPGVLITIYPTIIKVVSNEKIAAIYEVMFKEENTEETFNFGEGE